MSQFIYEYMLAKKIPTDQDTLAYLYRKALEAENVTVLSLLTTLNFNILHHPDDLLPLLKLSKDFDDYSFIYASFDKATPKMKQLLLEFSLMK